MIMIPPTQIIGPDHDPYMLRWILFRFRHWPRVYLHKILRSDDDRALHDHPWWFISFLLKGSYTEQTPQGAVRRDSPSVAFRPLSTRHRVWLPEGFHAWTLVITGPDVRGWGFWCPDIDQGTHVGDHWVPWRQFDGCGE